MLDKIIEDAVHTYINAFADDSLEAIMDLYAEDCRIEDPVGSEPIVGKAAVRAFYKKSVGLGVKLELESQVRIAGNEAAFAFKGEVQMPDGKMIFYPIDVMTFDDAGKVVSMRAYWGPANTENQSVSNAKAGY